ncbi:hypothetical protein C441_10386 [Haloferax sulfurifontis ATCC BAA-897]|uniref:Uncharacterized protein n=1 Tax=Haloferax sulfurifontis ATCC BAA-897 TaxID=662480 RepID=M0ICV5_9EURY|nr:hypothetical protein C441_10386 [Haloferax sulfurifontis ATCC BAA-897]
MDRLDVREVVGREHDAVDPFGLGASNHGRGGLGDRHRKRREYVHESLPVDGGTDDRENTGGRRSGVHAET